MNKGVVVVLGVGVVAVLSIFYVLIYLEILNLWFVWEILQNELEKELD